MKLAPGVRERIVLTRDHRRRGSSSDGGKIRRRADHATGARAESHSGAIR